MPDRWDASGFFWDDVGKKRPERLGWMPPIPETGWKPPAEFPNLSAAKALGIDLETWDPELNDAGPGWGRGGNGKKGHVVGFSIAVHRGPKLYFPLRHTVEPSDNRDPETCFRWLSYQLNDDRPKIGLNIIYDLGWLREEGVAFKGPFYDPGYAEALLDSERPNCDLESISQKYCGRGKETTKLESWLSAYYPGHWKANIYRAPPRLVGPYGEEDAALPLEAMVAQWPLLQQRGVMDVFKLECRLIPLLLDMRFKGAPVDVAYAEQLASRIAQVQAQLEDQGREISGRTVNFNSGDDLGAAFDSLGLRYERTAGGKPSFTSNFLETVQHPIGDLVREWRRLDKLRSTFVQGYIIDKNVNGRIHCEFHPLRGEDAGARSGRFASSGPNLQNIPVRDKKGQEGISRKEIRRCIRALKKRWRTFDYSQIEYRMLAHHAVGEGADQIRDMYQANPKTDYHKATGKMILEMTAQDLPREYVKNINFGLIYGMSEPALAEFLHLELKKAKELFAAYHRAVPFARATMAACASEIDLTGAVRTILGRVSDFNSWVPKEYTKNAIPLPYDEALMQYGYDIERAFKHKGLNRKLQGGAADMMKAAMVQAYEGGIFDATGIPLLTVHDELDFDDEYEDENAPAWAELKHCMENAIKLSVPVVAESSFGATWADCK